MSADSIKIEASWKQALAAEFEKPYFIDLSQFVRKEYLKKIVYPTPREVFRAFDLTSFDKVKVVILGQDPYHGPKEAKGLAFAVHDDVKIPPSLKNIFTEIQTDIGIIPITHGDISRWAKQGVLLLNSTLTVQASTPGSHQKKGWEEFTDAVIRKLSKEKKNLVFMLWGNYAKQKGLLIDRSKHLVLEAAHPSPFSVYNGFFGCKHFSKANQYLKDQGLSEIDWR